MLREEYQHAIKVLRKKQKISLNELAFVHDEERLMKHEYIDTNSKFKIGDRVSYTNKPDYSNIAHGFIVRNISVKDDGSIMFDIGNYTTTMHRDLLGKYLKLEEAE